MSSAPKSKVGQVNIFVSKDRLKAWIRQPNVAAPGYRPPTADEVVALLEAAGIAVDDDMRQRLEEFAATTAGAGDSADGPPEIPEKYLIAVGKPPVEPENGSFKWSNDPAESKTEEGDDGSIDYFAQTSIRTIEAGVTIGRITPPTDGVEGLDVFGEPIRPQRRRGVEIEVGRGLRLGEDGSGVITETAGRVLEKLNKLSVQEVLEIGGDVCFESGSIDVCVDVCVRGAVLSNFHVRTTKSLEVAQTIEAANISVDGNIVVRGGICGGGEVEKEGMGRVRAGGCITARFCNEAVVSAGGDVHVEKETLNSHVSTTEHLVSERGTIIGGYVWAREGIEVAVLGSDAGVVTYAAAGTPPRVLQQAKQMEKEVADRLRSAERIGEKVQPLMSNLKRLTPQQRETATELIAKAGEMQMEAEATQAKCAQMIEEARPSGKARILVEKMIYPAVRIVLGGREAHISKEIAGPVKIEQRKVEGATELVYVNQRTGSVTVLPSTDVDLDALPAEQESAGGEDGNGEPGNEERKA